MKIIINDILLKEALDYAKLSRAYTSDTHDFHEGGLDAKQKKMFQGKIGEKAIKQYLINNKIQFNEDKSSHKEADKYDFIIYGKNRKYLVDVKTRTQDFHTRTLEMVKQMKTKNIDIYISVKLEKKSNSKYEVLIIGWCSKKDFIKKNRIENNGYLDNYVLYDNELRKIKSLLNYL